MPSSTPHRFPARRLDGSFVKKARALLALLTALSARLGVRCAALLFCTPPRYARSRKEQRVLDAAQFGWVRRPRGAVAVWRWGKGPLVLLAHGWGGHAGRLAGFVRPLLDAGFSVMAFDAPGHGSSRGTFATLPDFLFAIEAIVRNEKPVALVGHSMGAAACALAIREGLPVKGAVLLAPPVDPRTYTARFARFFRLPASVAEGMNRRLESRYGMRMADLCLTNRPSSTPILVVHDRRDVRVSIKDGMAIVDTWPAARLIPTRGLGHHKILRDPGVIRRTVRFLRALNAPADLPAIEVEAVRAG